LLAVFVALSSAIQWKAWENPNIKIERTIVVEKAPPLFPFTVEVRATETVSRVSQGVVIRDAIDYLFSVLGFPHWTVRHFASFLDIIEARAGRHGLRKLVEYIETGAANSGFDPDQDIIVSQYPFWTQTWSPLVVASVSVGTATLTTVCSHTSDGVVEICTYITNFDTAFTINGTTFLIDNNAVHHYLKISNFKFTNSTSKLALKVQFESRTVITDLAPDTVNNENDAALVGTAGDPIQPAAAWSNAIIIAGPGCAATGTVVKDIYRDVESIHDIDVGIPMLPANETVIALNLHITYFSFLTGTCQPTTIFWDPEVGIMDSTAAGMNLVPSLLLVFFAIIGLLVR